MSHTITLTSLSELADALGLDPVPEDDTDDAVEQSSTAAETGEPALNLTDLLREIETASGSLSAVVRRDNEVRAVALQELERYDSVLAKQREAEQTRTRAEQLRREAEALSERAFAEEARAEATRIGRIAIQAEVAAVDAVNRWQAQAEQLASQLDLDRLLEERRRQEEAEKAKAAEAERTRRLAGTLARARVALEAGRFEEAMKLLGPVTSENPGNPEITTLKTIIAQRELAVKVDAAEEVLWEARRVYRCDPARAVRLLEALDVEALPEQLSRQVFGEWARACSRLCRERNVTEPLRYSPDPGRGAVWQQPLSGGQAPRGCWILG
jgi:tetratricopeptide (TPR) repeat protein